MSRPYAEVIGDPISHSKSPLIHNFWLGKLGVDAEYRLCHVRPDELQGYFDTRREDPDWRGCNVTIPHKVATNDVVDLREPEARWTGAVNTVFPANHDLVGTNTDIDGILAALPEELMPPGSAVCILGTGGAARAAMVACRKRDVGHVTIRARNRAAATGLMQEFGCDGEVEPLDGARNLRTASVIINATSLGMTGQAAMPQVVLDSLRDLHPEAAVFDMVYSPLETELLRKAAASGLRTVGGLAMLIGQAAAAFERFFKVLAPREHDDELRRILTS